MVIAGFGQFYVPSRTSRSCCDNSCEVEVLNQCLHHVLDTLFADLISIISEICGYQLGMGVFDCSLPFDAV